RVSWRPGPPRWFRFWIRAGAAPAPSSSKGARRRSLATSRAPWSPLRRRDASPVGQRIRFTVLGTPLAAEIVSVVGDTQQTALDLPGTPAVYVSSRQVPS